MPPSSLDLTRFDSPRPSTHVWQEHLLHVRAIFAQNVLVWHMQEAAPPPLTLLGLPFELMHTLRTFCHLCVRKYDELHGDGINHYYRMSNRPRYDATEAQLRAPVDAPSKRFVSRTFRKRQVLEFERTMWQQVDKHTHEDDSELLDFRVEAKEVRGPPT
jgi:hypothetical protein